MKKHLAVSVITLIVRAKDKALLLYNLKGNLLSVLIAG
jgi:hypothetical protein